MGWNGYRPEPGSNRAFKYLTPKKRLTGADLADHPSLLHAKAFHIVSSPNRCQDVVHARMIAP